MLVYRERLGVPAWWWPLTAASVLLLGTTLWAGFSLVVAALVYAVMSGAAAALLWSWGRARIEVTGTDLRAGTERLALEQIGEVTALDRAQTRALRGPHADPAAYLLIRPYLDESVYVEVTGQSPRPYWLIGTRHPGELAAAIRAAAAAAGTVPPCDDSSGDARKEPDVRQRR